MFVSENEKKTAMNIQGVRYDQYMALLRAAQHELVRSKKRASDENLLEQSRAREIRNHEVLTECIRRLLTFEDFASNKLQIS